jgi:hypothetical protein
MRGNWKENPFSPNHLSRRILWWLIFITFYNHTSYFFGGENFR